MSADVRRRRRTVEERIGAQLRHGKPGDLQGRGEPLKRDRGAIVSRAGGPSGGDSQPGVEHLTVYPTAGQAITAAGGQIMIDRVAGPPTERGGFRTFSVNLAADGEVAQIAIDLRGLCRVRVVLPFQAEVTGAATITLTRDGTDHVLLAESGTGDTYEAAPMCWVRPDDTVAVTVDPDADALLSSDEDRRATIEVSIWEYSGPTSDVPLPTVATLGDFNVAEDGDGDVVVGRPDDVASGDVLVAFVTGNLGGGLGVTWPDGFDPVGSAETSTHVAAAVKEATGSEPAHYAFAWMESFGGISAVVAVVHGGSIGAVGAVSESGPDTITVGPLSPTVGVCLIGVAGGGEVADASLLTASLGAEIWVADGGAARDVEDPGALAAVAVIVGGG